MLSLRDEAAMLALEMPVAAGRNRGALLAASPSFAAIVRFSGRFSGLFLPCSGQALKLPLIHTCVCKAPVPFQTQPFLLTTFFFSVHSLSLFFLLLHLDIQQGVTRFRDLKWFICHCRRHKVSLVEFGPRFRFLGLHFANISTHLWHYCSSVNYYTIC